MADDIAKEVQAVEQVAVVATKNGWGARDIAVLVTAITAMIVSVAAILKPESSARKSYAATTEQVTKLSDDAKGNKDDIEGLRTYLQKEHADPVPVPLAPIPVTVVPLHVDAGAIVLRPSCDHHPPLPLVPRSASTRLAITR